MLSRAQNTFHHNPRLRGPVSSIIERLPWRIHCIVSVSKTLYVLKFKLSVRRCTGGSRSTLELATNGDR